MRGENVALNDIVKLALALFIPSSGFDRSPRIAGSEQDPARISTRQNSDCRARVAVGAVDRGRLRFRRNVGICRQSSLPWSQSFSPSSRLNPSSD
jgi:hypothetical protein